MVETRSRLARTALVVSVLASGAALGWFAARRVADATPKLFERHETLVNTATVLVAIRNLSRLESVSFHMERVIDLKDRQSLFFGLLQADDAILLVASGDVVAGVDLAKMRDGDVVIEPTIKRAELTLPSPEVLSVHLDNQRTYVHSRTTDLLAQRQIELETRARQHAEDSIRDAALEAGILEKARANTVHTLTALVRSLGYDQVDIGWRFEMKN
jgi:hypothetical protein